MEGEDGNDEGGVAAGAITVRIRVQVTFALIQK
jgi:hypothetical protein